MSQIAKYRQVESFIKDRIVNGTYPVGTRLMTEEELVDRFGFSRMTINKALSNLSNDGFIERKPGKGTRPQLHRRHEGDWPHSRLEANLV